jgi:ribosomal protein L24E
MSTITKCDHCGAVLNQGIGKRFSLECPDGWLHFCNWDCLYQWLKVRRGHV